MPSTFALSMAKKYRPKCLTHENEEREKKTHAHIERIFCVPFSRFVTVAVALSLSLRRVCMCLCAVHPSLFTKYIRNISYSSVNFRCIFCIFSRFHFTPPKKSTAFWKHTFFFRCRTHKHTERKHANKTTIQGLLRFSDTNTYKYSFIHSLTNKHTHKIENSANVGYIQCMN